MKRFITNTKVKFFVLLNFLLLIFISSKGITNAQFLNYQVLFSSTQVEAGKDFTLQILLKNNTSSTFYNVSVYLYQGHNIFNTSVVSVNPQYNANFTDPNLSTIYNPKYWITDRIMPQQISTYQVTYHISESAEDGQLKTIGYTPITQGKPIQDAIDNPVSELLIDILYYSDPTLTPPPRTIRTYVDLPSVFQPLADISSKKLPNIFTASGTETTNISQIKKNQADNYTNFTLDTVEGNMIIWVDPLNLNDTALLAKIESIDKYVFITQLGKISVDTTSVPFLNKKAKIVFKHVQFLSPPILLKDGEEVSDDTQKTGSCEREKKMCSFIVPSFSTYTIRPILQIDIPQTSQNESISLTGYVNDLDAKVKYSINNEDYRNIGPIDIENGEFKLELKLSNGVNTLTFVAESKNGEKDEVYGTIIYADGGQSKKEEEENVSKPVNVVLLTFEIASVVIAAVVAIVILLWVYKRKKEEKEVMGILQKGPMTQSMKEENIKQIKTRILNEPKDIK